MEENPDSSYNLENSKENSSKIDHEKKPLLGLRWVLVILSFSSYCILFFVRNSFSVALVAMINANESTEDSDYTRDTCITLYNQTEEAKANDGEFDWSASEQGVILGAFFWGFIISRLFLSRVGELVGQRATAAIGICGGGLLTFLGPLTAYIHPYALAVDRFLIGVCYGPIYAALQSLLSAWAPRRELATMISITFSGMTIGGIAGLVLSGWLSDNYGWRSSFWIGGILNLIFLPFWIICIRNSPKEHPWLTPYERNLLEENNNVTTKKTVPWLKILSSRYLHICILGQFARTWLDAVVATEGPAFFSYKLGLKLSTGSYICAANYLACVVLLVFFGRISDYIINHNYVSKVNARRLCHLISNGGAAAMLIGIALADCNSMAVIILWVLLGGFSAGTTCSYNISAIDLAPNYTGTFVGLYGVGNLGAAITPSVTSAFLSQDNGWSKTFYLAAFWNLLSCVTYIPFISAEAQPWNFDNDNSKTELKKKPV